MKEYFQRSRILIGDEAQDRLEKATIVVLGLGGVGGNCCEALVRAGVGSLIIADHDVYSASNINRQLFATSQTLGQRKTRAAAERLMAVNPYLKIREKDCFIIKDTLEEIIPKDADYVVDCIDTVTAKLDVAEYCQEHGIPLLSSMGAGNKLDPGKLVFKDVFDTKMDPLAKVMRHELRRRGVKKLKVLYSEEKPRKPRVMDEEPPAREEGGLRPKRMTPGSVSFVPPVAGIMLAGYVVRDLIGEE